MTGCRRGMSCWRRLLTTRWQDLLASECSPRFGCPAWKRDLRVSMFNGASTTSRLSAPCSSPRDNVHTRLDAVVSPDSTRLTPKHAGAASPHSRDQKSPDDVESSRHHSTESRHERLIHEVHASDLHARAGND